MNENSNRVVIDGREITLAGEANVLTLCHNHGIDIPTFCYHSHLSVYGGCRLCLVEIDKMGIVASCSTTPRPGMVIHTHTEEVQRIRRIAMELLLASHDQHCTTCSKSAACRLQDLAERMGIESNRFKTIERTDLPDLSSPSIKRDPRKCILCGDCVRACNEIQGIGALDFVGRGSQVTVGPAFGKKLAEVDCVNCGQCAAVCPTGAITVVSDLDEVWKALHDPHKKVVAQIAPAVRVAVGETFGLPAGTLATGQVAAALKEIGFDRVYDTSFTADMTVLEEAEEFIARVGKGEHLPQFTSCCPAWVKFAEQYYPEYLANLSSCRSPQQMFGSMAKSVLPEQLGVPREDLVVVSVMPCTAKKFEAGRDEFHTDGGRDVDLVITTQELIRMIRQAGIRFDKLAPESLDMPFGFKTGAGVIFGTTGGVAEAVLRYAADKLTDVKRENYQWKELHEGEGIREFTVRLGEHTLRLAVVAGLANAKRLLSDLKSGAKEFDLIEVMACPQGCVSGAGQPTPAEGGLAQRRRGLYDADVMLELHKAQENPYLAELYQHHLGEVGGEKAHHLLHTSYHSRRRIDNEGLALTQAQGSDPLTVSVCIGTNCHLRGSQDILHGLIRYVEQNELVADVEVHATFCYEQCDRGPTVQVGNQVLEKCTLERAQHVLTAELSRRKQGVPDTREVS
ncbi:MAG TPA: [FeFe] hydrogenase, group A [Candidatus Aminicenantes bacterium]|nr:[FeFe] hydrogenase, group A [Candidatus Aminicenantes bacterium]